MIWVIIYNRSQASETLVVSLAHLNLRLAAGGRRDFQVPHRPTGHNSQRLSQPMTYEKLCLQRESAACGFVKIPPETKQKSSYVKCSLRQFNNGLKTLMSVLLKW